MSDTLKIQMTEEQFDKFYLDCCADFGVVGGMAYQRIKTLSKERGFILKSSLRQKVEEAEEIYNTHIQYFSSGDVRDITIKLYETIQLLKQSHPEFKK